MWPKTLAIIILTYILTSQSVIGQDSTMFAYRYTYMLNDTTYDYFRVYISLYSLDPTLHRDILYTSLNYAFEPGFYQYGLEQYNFGKMHGYHEGRSGAISIKNWKTIGYIFAGFLAATLIYKTEIFKEE